MFAAICPCGQMLSAIFNPPDRTIQLHGKITGANLFRQKYALISETAADIRCNHANLSMIHIETVRESGSNNMGHLSCGMKGEDFQISIPPCDQTTTFNWRHALARCFEASTYDYICLCNGRVEIDVGIAFQK